MADLSRVNEKITTIAQKVDELLARPQGAVDGGGGGIDQAEVDAMESRLDEILARLP